MKLLVGANFFVKLVTENVLIAKEIFNFGLINWHFFVINVVHRLALVSVPVFDGIIFPFRDLG